MIVCNFDNNKNLLNSTIGGVARETAPCPWIHLSCFSQSTLRCFRTSTAKIIVDCTLHCGIPVYNWPGKGMSKRVNIPSVAMKKPDYPDYPQCVIASTLTIIMIL